MIFVSTADYSLVSPRRSLSIGSLKIIICGYLPERDIFSGFDVVTLDKIDDRCVSYEKSFEK